MRFSVKTENCRIGFPPTVSNVSDGMNPICAEHGGNGDQRKAKMMINSLTVAEAALICLINGPTWLFVNSRPEWLGKCLEKFQRTKS